ncbi:hypothetical protein [Bradyrhizobium sp. 1(2017)]|uniref:hypothetical protein n=1 Tax=Bradyrhizobium sp. 1(2017) TaxID=1404888 RepID=UPI00140EC955|nr:hypothetical protein [Bradyrhizobium sp. 1(2017)]QIO36033.1 hypothetical protein HAP40_31570 [Bradyrhizobium sp. 1(2017)]
MTQRWMSVYGPSLQLAQCIGSSVGGVEQKASPPVRTAALDPKRTKLGRFQGNFHLSGTKRPCHLDGFACRCTAPANQPDGIDIRNALPVRFDVCAERRYLLGFEINFSRIKLQICFYNKDGFFAGSIENVFDPNRPRVPVRYHWLLPRAVRNRLLTIDMMGEVIVLGKALGPSFAGLGRPITDECEIQEGQYSE